MSSRSSYMSKLTKPSKRKALDMSSSQDSTLANASESSDSEVEVEEVEEEKLVLPGYVINARATPRDALGRAKERLDQLTKKCFLIMAEGVKNNYVKPHQVIHVSLHIKATPQREVATEKAILYMNRLGWNVEWAQSFRKASYVAYVNIKEISSV